MVCGGLWVVCGDYGWVVVVGCGLLWLVVACCGWLWLVVVGCGRIAFVFAWVLM